VDEKELRTWKFTRPDSDIEELVVEMADRGDNEPDDMHLCDRPKNYAKLRALNDDGWLLMDPAPLLYITIDGRTHIIPSGIIVVMGRRKPAVSRAQLHWRTAEVISCDDADDTL